MYITDGGIIKNNGPIVILWTKKREIIFAPIFCHIGFRGVKFYAYAYELACFEIMYIISDARARHDSRYCYRDQIPNQLDLDQNANPNKKKKKIDHQTH